MLLIVDLLFDHFTENVNIKYLNGGCPTKDVTAATLML